MKNKTVYIIIGVILLIVVVFGITYAAISWASDPNSGFVNGTSECFKIDYVKGIDVTDGTLVLGNDYTSGLNTTVSAVLSDECPTMDRGNGTLYIDVKDATSDYFIDNELLRYQVLEDGEEVADGVLTAKGRNEVYSDIEITKYEKEFTVYIWVSKQDVNDTNISEVSNSTYSVGIQMSAESR